MLRSLPLPTAQNMPINHHDLANQVDNLYREHAGWLLGLLRSRVGCGSTAEDLTQDVFIRLLGKPNGSFFQDPQNPRAYLARIAKGLVVDRYRRLLIERAYLDYLSLIPEPSAPSAEQQHLIIESLTLIDAMLGSLKPKVREAFLLSRFDGLTYAEIAQQLQTSVATVRKYMLIAMQNCLKVMETQ